MVKTIEQQRILEIARKRLDFPETILNFDYQKDADVLVIRFSNNPSTRSKMNHEKGALVNYGANGKIVSLEIFDFYGVFV